MFRVVTIAATLLLSIPSFAQSHSAIDSARSSYGKNLFFDQSFLAFYGRITKSGDESVFGAREATWTGSGIRDGIGIEMYKFIHLAFYHTHIDQESKGGALEHFNGSELSGEVTFSFSSPMGNLGFGAGVFGGQVNMQNVDKTSRFAGTGRVTNISWNYFLTSSLSLMLRVERADGNYSQSSGDTGVESFEMTRDGFAAGFKLWL
ncbi:hypothetical protein [Pseudobacteriovorax antillogorgiicola]|uniref:Outer membrane protein beta-barrel domain-containing protein n=2 Tax=Pseudobacteriovorax antillogorgiicola TaxID=1513793 RepID=A0A1Y6CBN1_9BACT|nr:hypothetical protein [Pseudobacteriovorax antillogorgiicola]TCS48680.1 hypothetical protein EDD56_117102 [Pseudobacteriovorax antillogorgiicola]SMF54911.1 hypothetical protein SAMN06296036_11757 [Pseudobacteriovorax antillogorgiicola]